MTPSAKRRRWRVHLFLHVRRFVSLCQCQFGLHVFRARSARFRFSRRPINRTRRRVLPCGRRCGVGRAFNRSPGSIFHFRLIRFNSSVLLPFFNRQIAKGTFPWDVLVNGEGRCLATVRRVKSGVQVVSDREIKLRVGTFSCFFGHHANRLDALLKDVSTSFDRGMGWDVTIHRCQCSFDRLTWEISALSLLYVFCKINKDRLRLRLFRFRPRVHLVRPNFFRQFLRVHRVSEIQVPFREGVSIHCYVSNGCLLSDLFRLYLHASYRREGRWRRW